MSLFAGPLGLEDNASPIEFMSGEPERFEPRYTVTKLSETGIEIMHHFVIRDNKYLVWKIEQKKIF